MQKSSIYGVEIDFGRYDDFRNKLLALGKSRKSSYAVFINAHMLYEIHNSNCFRDVIKNADLVCPDGMPLYYSTRLFGNGVSERIAGNDMIFTMLRGANEQSQKVFFYGTSPNILDKIELRIQNEYPTLEFKTYSPPFRKLTSQELECDIKMINDFETNIVFVGLGCPKQERWMSEVKGRIDAMMLGVGGALLLFAGVDSRAPKWMRNLSMEWVYRLALEPKRLFKRYLITNTYFCFLFFKEVKKRMLKRKRHL
jgi:N-acetylglucosaminyldiphosphoundecaprenol N-acetyl-beta-D-mannosaminyltransferase